MVFYNGRKFDYTAGPPLPPRIKAAFDFLDHVRVVTAQYDVSIPPRTLSPLEKSVELAALRVLQQYLLGEMDFAENPPSSKSRKREDEDGSASTPANTPA
jgi:hypothetical protein